MLQFIIDLSSIDTLKERMKFEKVKVKLCFLVFAFVALSSHAAPLVTIGDIGTISLNAQAAYKWDNNIFRQETNEVKDVLLTFSPGFNAVLGRNAADLDIGLSTSVDFNRFQDRDELDSELLHFAANAAYRSSRLELSAHAAYDETKSNTELANRDGDLLERETTTFGLEGEYTLSPKLSFGFGVNWDEIAYVGNYAADYDDRAYTKFPLDIFYELTPKLDLSAGYIRSNIDVERDGLDATTDNINVGLRGELLPKLSGFFKIGYNQYENDNGSRDTASMSIDSTLSWNASSKFTHKLTFYRNFDASAVGTGTEITDLKWSTSYFLNNKTMLSARAGFKVRDYLVGGREDELTSLGVNGSYRINSNWNINAGYVFTNNDSNLAGSSYDDDILTITAILTY